MEIKDGKMARNWIERRDFALHQKPTSKSKSHDLR